MDWFSLLGGACLYVRLSPERLVVRDARAGRMFDQAAVLAVTRAAPRRIVAVGDQAVLAAAGAQQPVDLVRPFAHPRTLMADFTGGEQLLKAAIQTVLRGRWLALSPRVLMHPVGEPVGGLTQVEIRALQEMARGAGAHGVTVWQGPLLTDEQVLARQYPAAGQVLA
ncbi:rod shape-determining protein [Ottowia oryzae]